MPFLSVNGSQWCPFSMVIASTAFFTNCTSSAVVIQLWVNVEPVDVIVVVVVGFLVVVLSLMCETSFPQIHFAVLTLSSVTGQFFV